MLEQLSFDHSLVWEMRASGQLPNGEVPDYVPRNVITRSLGPNAKVQVDLEGPLPVMVGDTFLLCSDGLSGPVKDDEIGIILGCLPPSDAVQTLIDLAKLRGGPDNITVIVARVTAPLTAAEAGSPAAAPDRRAAVRDVHPLLWTALGVSGLATLGLAVLGIWWVAAAALLAVVVVAVVIVSRRYSGGGGPQDFASAPIGRGPYTSTPVAPNREFSDRLAGIVGELREAATREDWKLDWSRFRGHLDRATAAREAADYAQAAQQYCYAMSFMMAQLKPGRK